MPSFSSFGLQILAGRERRPFQQSPPPAAAGRAPRTRGTSDRSTPLHPIIFITAHPSPVEHPYRLRAHLAHRQRSAVLAQRYRIPREGGVGGRPDIPYQPGVGRGREAQCQSRFVCQARDWVAHLGPVVAFCGSVIASACRFCILFGGLFFIGVLVCFFRIVPSSFCICASGSVRLGKDAC